MRRTHGKTDHHQPNGKNQHPLIGRCSISDPPAQQCTENHSQRVHHSANSKTLRRPKQNHGPGKTCQRQDLLRSFHRIAKRDIRTFYFSRCLGLPRSHNEDSRLNITAIFVASEYQQTECPEQGCVAAPCGRSGYLRVLFWLNISVDWHVPKEISSGRDFSPCYSRRIKYIHVACEVAFCDDTSFVDSDRTR